MLTPKWEKLANELKNTVKVAYWDTEANGPTPPLLGQIKGTPTIKAFVPSRKSARNEKTAVDYEQAREVKDLVRFATSRMPNFVERVGTLKELEAVQAKAAEWGLPIALALSSSGGTASTLKALSTEYRRRLIVAEHKAKQGGGSGEPGPSPQVQNILKRLAADGIEASEEAAAAALRENDGYVQKAIDDIRGRNQ